MEYIILAFVILTLVISMLAYLSARNANNNILSSAREDNRQDLIRDVRDSVREMEQNLSQVERDEQEVSRVLISLQTSS